MKQWNKYVKIKIKKVSNAIKNKNLIGTYSPLSGAFIVTNLPQQAAANTQKTQNGGKLIMLFIIELLLD